VVLNLVIERFAKSGARVAGTGAGSFLGGFFNNPGVVVIAGVAIALFLFRDRISAAFGSLGESIGGIGNFEFPDITLPTINFPAINFPDITFPSFGDFNFPDFGAGLAGFGETITQAFDDFSKQFVPPESQDVPFGDTGRTIDVVPELGRQDPRRDAVMISPEEAAFRAIPEGEDISGAEFASARNFLEFRDRLTPAQQFAVTERGADPLGFITIPPGTSPQEVSQIIVPESQAGFQARAADFVRQLTEAGIAEQIVGSTSLPGAPLIMGEQLSRNQEDFGEFVQTEQQRAGIIFQNLFGNVQNPDFPITLGEFIGGESGTVVSPSLFGASQSEIETFFSQQGF